MLLPVSLGFFRQRTYLPSSRWLSLPFFAFPSHLRIFFSQSDFCNPHMRAQVFFRPSVTLFLSLSPQNLTFFLSKPICSVAPDPVSFRAARRRDFPSYTCPVSSFAFYPDYAIASVLANPASISRTPSEKFDVQYFLLAPYFPSVSSHAFLPSL